MVKLVCTADYTSGGIQNTSSVIQLFETNKPWSNLLPESTWAPHVLHESSVDQHREDIRYSDSPDSRYSPSRRAADTEALAAWDIDAAPQGDARWTDSDLDATSKNIHYISTTVHGTAVGGRILINYYNFTHEYKFILEVAQK